MKRTGQHHGWRPATRPQVHPAGTIAARPAHPDGCWATTLPKGLTEPRSCGSRRQAERLTCRVHAARNDDAVKLREELDAQADREALAGTACPKASSD